MGIASLVANSSWVLVTSQAFHSGLLPSALGVGFTLGRLPARPEGAILNLSTWR